MTGSRPCTLVIYAVLFEEDGADPANQTDVQCEEQIKVTARLEDLMALLNHNATAQTIRQMALRTVQAVRRQEFQEQP